MSELRRTSGSARQRRRNRQPMALQAEKTERGTISTTLLRDVLILLISVLRTHPTSLKIAAVPVLIVLSFFLMNVFFGGRVPPNISILDTNLGGLKYDAAIDRLEITWIQDNLVQLSADNRVWTATPSDLGLNLDARASVESTNNIGLAGIPFGYQVDPTITVDESRMRQYLEELAKDIYVAPINARYEWCDDSLSPVLGQSGVQLDVDATMNQMLESPLELLERDISLITVSLSPEENSPHVFLNAAQAFVTSPFELSAYDPFEDRYVSLTVTSETRSTWIEVNSNGLNAHESSITHYVDAINNSSSSGLPEGSYLKTEEVIAAINHLLTTGSSQANVTIRFYPSTYEVVSGDTGYRISRKTGIPFFLIEETNPERDLSILSPGDRLSLPSRDVTLPFPVIANKRIIVDLATQSLVAYENGQVIFSWQISSGVSDAPTSPGIYQILSQEPVAYGSSYTLCDDAGCGQWELNWFMGIYEVVPGLVNGFHGAVLLPNGGYLGGNNVGVPYTLGCVMSRDDQARQLYEWAEIGTVVEILSSEFAPQSELARRAFNL